MYLAFQDKDKLTNVKSKVANFIGSMKDSNNEEKASAADAMKAMMSPNKSSETEITRRIFEQGLKAASLQGNNQQSASQAQKVAEINKIAQFEQANRIKN